MAKRFLILYLVLGLNGCWLFQPQDVLLDPTQVEMIQNEFGRLNKKNLDDWLKAAELATGSEVQAIRETQEGILVRLSPPVVEAGVKAGESLLTSVVKDPGYTGIIAGIPAAFFALASVISKRSQLKGAKKNA